VKSFYATVGGALAVIALGVTAAMAGEADDAPGLALIGIVLIVGAFALAVRAAYARGRASVSTTSRKA
jgi:hypothetical protein